MRLHSTTLFTAVGITIAIALAACGGEKIDSAATPDPSGGLTAFQLEHGVGPVTEVLELKTIDDVLADSGAASFNMKCAACHKMDARYVGPALGGVTTRRSPAYVLNMILNPDEMIKVHPDARQMLAEYMTVMPNQNIQRPEARALLEYLRRTDAQTAAAGQ